VSRTERDAQVSGELQDVEGTLVANAVATLRIVKRRAT
jgi:hypothetical protein